MYEEFYNLRAEPFRLSPDHRFCFNHSSYAKAKAYMKYAYQRAEGFVMITGRPGTGKTTLVNDLINSLDSREANVGMLVCTQLEAEDLLRMVADAFGIPSNTNQKSQLLQSLSKLFTDGYSAGKRALLIIDEAQDLSMSALEELRLLTNLQINSMPLLQIFLLGQEELRDMVQQPSMEQVHQRLVAACHLRTLQEDETKSYIKHRLGQVGWNGDPAISEAVYPVIHKFSLGIPRRINMLCSRLFLHGCVEELHQIGIQDAKIVLNEIKQEQLTSEEIPADSDFDVEDIYEKPELAPVENINEAKKEPEKPPKVDHALEQAVKASSAPNSTIQKGAYHVGASEDASPDTEYRGPRSRKGPRRSGEDRRGEVRFEPRSSERRQNPGRRKEDTVSTLLSRRLWGKLKR